MRKSFTREEILATNVCGQDILEAICDALKKGSEKTDKVIREQNKLYEDALVLLKREGYYGLTAPAKSVRHSGEITSLDIVDYSLAVQDNMDKIRGLLGEGFDVQRLSNAGLIEIKLKNK